MGIAKKFYGDGSQYARIAGREQRRREKPQPDLPGQVLTIPAAGDLPSPMPASTMATANATKSTYDATGTWKLESVMWSKSDTKEETSVKYELLLTSPGGSSTRDIAQLVQTMSWSGSVDQGGLELPSTPGRPRRQRRPRPWEEGEPS